MNEKNKHAGITMLFVVVIHYYYCTSVDKVEDRLVDMCHVRGDSYRYEEALKNILNRFVFVIEHFPEEKEEETGR